MAYIEGNTNEVWTGFFCPAGPEGWWVGIKKMGQVESLPRSKFEVFSLKAVGFDII